MATPLEGIVVTPAIVGPRNGADHMDRELVQRYADRVMAFVCQDMDSGLVPRTVGSFSDLHEFVDANGSRTTPAFRNPSTP
jgi:hypothetical protein